METRAVSCRNVKKSTTFSEIYGQGINVRASFEVFINLLEQAKVETEDWGGKLIFVYLPNVKNNTRIGFFNEEMKFRIKKLGTTYIDGNDVFFERTISKN